jgi:hypothetical protein
MAPNHRRFSSFVPEVPPPPVAGNPDGTTSVVVVVAGAVVVVDLTVVVVVAGTVVLVGLVVVVVGLAVVVVVVAVVVVVGADALHVGTVIVFESKVTAPFRASSRPVTVAPVSSVIDVNARVVPARLVFVPSVSELPTTQKTLQAWAPFSSTTLLDDAVMNVDAASKMKTVDASPPPLSVSVPVSPNVPAAES